MNERIKELAEQAGIYNLELIDETELLGNVFKFVLIEEHITMDCILRGLFVQKE